MRPHQFTPIFFLTIISALFFSSCKRDKAAPVDSASNNSATEIGSVTLPTETVLPFACDLVRNSQMLEIIKINEELDVMDGNRSGTSSNASSCFYKWNDAVYGSSGVMIQVQKNPLPDELPDFVQAYIDNKKYEGENANEAGGAKYKYKDFEGLNIEGVQAIYNEELNRYYFAKDTKYLNSVAFNYPLKREVLDAYFVEIAKLMLDKI